MKEEIKQCQNCKQDFVIEPDDFGFYEKIKVLPPKICPNCRAQLRLSFRNTRCFYKNICANCKKESFSVYSPSNKTGWCLDCWRTDDMDSYKIGRDYDPNRNFFDQFNELFKESPKPNLVSIRDVDCSYVNYTADNKNCYMITESSNNENCINCFWIQISKDLIDCSFTHQVELSYEVDDCYDCHTLKFSKGCYGCLNSAFLLNCRGCVDCLGCINLRQQKYHIFNKPYSKEEYEKKLKSFRLDTYSGVENFKKEFQEFIKNKPRKFAEVFNAISSTGNYMTNVKNNKHCFHSYEAENNKYCLSAWRGAKDCMDCCTTGREAELNYNSINSTLQTSNLICTANCFGSNFLEYCINCPNSENCFGCAGLAKGSYCILNKQYSKEDYKKLRNEIIEKMKKDGIYGDFFPKQISPFGYNDSSACDVVQITKDEAIAAGFNWEDSKRGVYGKETISWGKFPDSILDLPGDFNITNEIFTCLCCNKNYRITINEFIFYRKNTIPIPRNCPDCRHTARLNKRGPNKLWHRKCMKDGCQNEFETSYPPDNPEIIYCERCYQQEIY